MLCGFVTFTWGIVIEKPKPTHIEKDYGQLELILEISEDIDDRHFMAKPMSLAVNERGDIYVYDAKLKAIFMFDKKGKFKKRFGRQGQGPSEFTGNDSGAKKLYYGEDGFLYVSAPFNKKIIVFDKQGQHIQDIRLPSHSNRREFFPVRDKSGRFYLLSSNKGAVDVFNPKTEAVTTLLSRQDYNTFLLHEPTFNFARKINPALWPVADNTYYDVFPGGLFIYLANPSRVFVFKDFKNIKQFSILPEKALIWLIEKNEREQNKNDGGMEYVNFIAENVFIDQDDTAFFYMFAYNLRNVYKFDFKGNLIKTINWKTGKNWSFLEIKKHNRFYGIRQSMKNASKIRVYQEVKK